jgi:hypothetical protein
MSNDVNFTVPVSTPQLNVVNGGDIRADHDLIAGHNVQAGVDINAANNVNATKSVTAGQNVSAGVDVTATRDVHATRDLRVDRNAAVSGSLSVAGTVSAGAVTGTEMYADHVNFSGYGALGPGGVPDGAVALLLNATVGGDGSITGEVGTGKTLAVYLGGKWWPV